MRNIRSAAEFVVVALPTVDDLVVALDQKRQTDLCAAESHLFNQHGLEALVPGFVAAYPRIRNAAGRNSVLFWLVRFARKYPEVVELAKDALSDSAYMPRMQACDILAYSLRSDAIPHLQGLLQHRDRKMRDHAAAAIDAIEHHNHHYWLERSHNGNFFWIVNPEDERPPNDPLQ